MLALLPIKLFRAFKRLRQRQGRKGRASEPLSRAFIAHNSPPIWNTILGTRGPVNAYLFYEMI